MSLLTERQQQCLQGFLERKTAKVIGRELGISHHAVEQHLKAARRKLGAESTLEAARAFAATHATTSPYYGSPEVQSLKPDRATDDRWVAKDVGQSYVLRDSAGESYGPAYELSPLQTLGAILLASFLLVAILALLIAAAQGVQLLTS